MDRRTFLKGQLVMPALVPTVKPQFTNAAGAPLMGGRLYTYEVGTNTPKLTYADAAGTKPNANPLILDARGEATIFWAGSYKVVLKDSNDAVVWALDNVSAADVLTAGLSASLAASTGSSLVSHIAGGNGAVARTVQEKLRDTISALDFGADNTGVTYTHAAIQAAIDYCIVNGRSLYIPAGQYKIGATLYLIRQSGEYRADALHIFGDGGGSIFLAYTLNPGTVLFTDMDVPIFTYPERKVGGFNTLHIDSMRLEQTSSATTSAVVRLEITSGYSLFSNLEIRQAGTGNGIDALKAYLTTIQYCNIVNRDLVSVGSRLKRVGTGVNIASNQAGGLLRLHKVTSRGWLNAYVLGNGTTGLISTKMEQCESSTCANGVTVSSNMVKTVLDTCYFEGIHSKCVIDAGIATTVRDCHFFEGFAVAIDATAATHGNVYRDNTIYLDGPNSVGIDIYSAGDGLGYGKYVGANHIFFLNPGGSVASVIGVRVTGANPVVSISDNAFRPRRNWVGGKGTTKIDTGGSTGTITGVIPVSDSLNEYPLLSNYSICLPATVALTESSVTSGVLTVPASGSSITISATVATSISSIVAVDQRNRIVMIHISNANTTFVKGNQMKLSANFVGPGMLLCDLRVIGRNVYLYEISRTSY